MSAPLIPRPGREGVSFHASPMLVGSAVAAVASTLLLAVLFVTIRRSLPVPPTGTTTGAGPVVILPILVALALCVVAWLAVLVAISRDQIVRQINRNTLEILAATREYGEHRETEGYLKARRAENLTRPTTAGPGASLGGSGGDVVQFPRQVPPPDHD